MNMCARIGLVMLCLCAATPAWAQATRTYVSGVGDDANPCSRTAPCKTFAGAISKTAASGEIDVLDPGGFGAVTITKSITIDGHAALGGILVSGTNGITVAAGATDVVVLRSLTFLGVGTGLTGVVFSGGGTLRVEDCAISGFVDYGIDFEPTVGTSSKLYVKNSVLGENAKGDIELNLNNGTISSSVLVEKSSLIDSPVGLEASGADLVSVHDTVFSGDATYGIHALATADVNVERGIVSNSGVGVEADGTSTIRLSDLMVSDNTTGIVAGATATVASFGNNRLNAGNTTNVAPSATLSQQ